MLSPTGGAGESRCGGVAAWTATEKKGSRNDKISGFSWTTRESLTYGTDDVEAPRREAFRFFRVASSWLFRRWRTSNGSPFSGRPLLLCLLRSCCLLLLCWPPLCADNNRRKTVRQNHGVSEAKRCEKGERKEAIRQAVAPRAKIDSARMTAAANLGFARCSHWPAFRRWRRSFGLLGSLRLPLLLLETIMQLLLANLGFSRVAHSSSFSRNPGVLSSSSSSQSHFSLSFLFSTAKTKK